MDELSLRHRRIVMSKFDGIPGSPNWHFAVFASFRRVPTKPVADLR